MENDSRYLLGPLQSCREIGQFSASGFDKQQTSLNSRHVIQLIVLSGLIQTSDSLMLLADVLIRVRLQIFEALTVCSRKENPRHTVPHMF